MATSTSSAPDTSSAKGQHPIAAALEDAGVDADSDAEVHLLDSRWARWVLIGLGTLFVGLGVLGAILPLLPTTPFLLVAAACYARGSERFYRWLLSNRLFGPSIRAWRRDRSMPLKAKRTAIVLIVVTFGITVGFVVTGLVARVLLVLLAAGIIVILLRIPASDYGGV